MDLLVLAYLMMCSAVVDAQPPNQTPSQRVAVLEIRGTELQESARKSLLAVVAETAAAAPWLKVISSDEITAMLDAEAQKQLVGCEDSTCLAEIAGALDVDLIITGSVANLGDGQVVTLQLINQRFANVMNRTSLTWPGAAEQLPEVTRAATQLLVLEPAMRIPGSIEIFDSPEMAEVFVDGERHGRINNTGTMLVEKVAVGVHLVRLNADGYQAREIPVVVLAGQQQRYQGALEPTPIYATWWFWTGVAVLGTLAVAVPVALFTFDDRAAISFSATDPLANGVSQ